MGVVSSAGGAVFLPQRLTFYLLPVKESLKKPDEVEMHCDILADVSNLAPFAFGYPLLWDD